MVRLLLSFLTLMFGLHPLPSAPVGGLVHDAEVSHKSSPLPHLLPSPRSDKVEVLNTESSRLLSVSAQAAEHGRPFILSASPLLLLPLVSPRPLSTVPPCKFDEVEEIPCSVKPPVKGPETPPPLAPTLIAASPAPQPEASILPCAAGNEHPCPLPVDPGDGAELVNPPVKVWCPPETHPAMGMPCRAL